jgi:flagellar biosynthesis chaperone FliJ
MQEEIKKKIAEIFDISGVESSTSEILEKALGVFLQQNTILKAKLSESKSFCDNIAHRMDELCGELAALKIAEQQNVVLTTDNSTLRDEISNLKNQIVQKDSEIAQCRQQLQLKDSELGNVTNSIESMKEICEKYSQIDISPMYSRLSEQTKEDLKIYFPNRDAIGLLSAGIQKDTVYQLYEYLFTCIKYNKLENYDDLFAIVESLFDIYNKGRKEPFVFITPQIGDDYDSSIHLPKGNSTGHQISKVWLFGYKNTQGKVLKQAFVSVN